MNAPVELHQERPQRLLVIAAHPHDADDAVGGSVARWVEQGTVAVLVCCTSGDGRADDADADPLALAAEREQGQRSAAAIIGYEEVIFLHRPEGALVNDLALREQLVRAIRTFRPDAVAAPDPRVVIHAWGQVNHVDHREAGAAAVDAVQPAAANALAFPSLVRAEGLPPHRVRRLYLFASERPNVAIDIGGTMEQKIRAAAAHAGSRAVDEDSLRARAREAGQPTAAGAAEALALIDLAW